MRRGQRLHLQHKGTPIRASLLESFIAPVDFEVGGEVVKKGSWYMSIYLGDAPEVFQAVLDGTYTGFSMSGLARTE